MNRVPAVVVVLALALGLLVGVQSSAQAAVPLKVSPGAPIANELFDVTGKLLTKVARPVELEQLSGSSWVRVREGTSSKSGAFSLAGFTPKTAKYRVVARKVTLKGKSYAKIVTATKTVTPTSQKVVLKLPSKTFRNQSVTATSTSTPARKGREVELEVLRDGSWSSVAVAPQDKKGVASFRLVAADVGTFSYRVTNRARRGAAPASSSARGVSVAPDKVVVSDDARPLTSSEASKIKSYSDASGALTFQKGAPRSVRQLKTGQVVPVPPRKGLPSGALRKITSVRTSGGVTAIKTKDADLPDVVENVPDQASAFAMTTTDATFVPAGGVSVRAQGRATKARGRSGLRASATKALELKLNAKLEKDGVYTEATGSMSLTPVIDFELDTDWGRVKHYKLGAGVDVDDDVTIGAGFGGSAASPKLPLGTLHATAVATIGPVLVWAEMVAPVYVQVEASGQIGVEVGYTQTGPITRGIVNERGSLRPTGYATDARTTSAISDVKAEGSLSAFAGVEPQLLLYSTGGGFAKVGYKASLNLKVTSAATTCSLEYGPYGEFGVKSADWVEKLTGEKFKVSTEVSFAKAEVDLCPALGPTTVSQVSPYFSNGDLRPDWKIADERDGGVGASCFDGSPVAPDGGVWECSPNGFIACWPDYQHDDAVICGDGPWDKTAQRVDATFEGEPVPGPGGQPWGLELADGTKCTSRHWGAWSARPNDEYVGAYYCQGRKSDDFLVGLVVPGGASVDRSGPVWTVKIGYLENDPRAGNAPVTAVVRKAIFAKERT